MLNLANNLIINIYSIIILIIIYSGAIRHREKDSFQNKLFIKMIYVTFIMLFADTFSRFDGNLGTLYPVFNYWGNLIIFSLSPVPSSIWLAYVHYQSYQDQWKTQKLMFPLILINLGNIIMVILTQYFGWYYYIDNANIYHRGRLFFLSPMITILLLLVAFVLIIKNRKRIVGKYYFALLFFAVPPLFSLVLQLNFYGLSLMLSGLVISILIVFLNTQDRSIYTDYLTGVSNRNKFQKYIENKVRTSTPDKTFSTIMIDLNDFKEINDNYGHHMGDYALQKTVELLRASIRSQDFIARFGGDEFLIILDISNEKDLQVIVDRMVNSFKKYNDSNVKPFNLEISCGYAVYDYHSNMSVEEFLKHIDKLMYKNKRAMKKSKEKI